MPFMPGHRWFGDRKGTLKIPHQQFPEVVRNTSGGGEPAEPAASEISPVAQSRK